MKTATDSCFVAPLSILGRRVRYRISGSRIRQDFEINPTAFHGQAQQPSITVPMLMQAPLPTTSPDASQASSLSGYWQSIMDIPGAPWIIWTSLLIILVLVAVYVAGLFRNLAIGGAGVDDTDHLSEFRKLRDQGMIDEEEYKRLTTVVPVPIPDSKLESKLANRGVEPSSVHPAPLAGAGGSNSEPARRPLTLAEAEALKREQEREGEEGSGSTDPDENNDQINP